LSGRRSMETDIFKGPTERPRDEAAPLLKKLMAEYAATGLPPAYIPKYSHEEESK